jgi:hypothetical protein
MKITQAKNYKKPLYAIGIAAAIVAASVSGCTDSGKISYAGEMDTRPTETSEVRLAGETYETEKTPTETSETKTASETTKRPTMTTKVILDGGAPIDDNDCYEA